MERKDRKGRWLVLWGLILMASIAIGGCEGGGGDGTTTPSTFQLSGTAATGKALTRVAVDLKDSKGTVVTTVADAQGKFSFDTSKLTPPFYLRTQGYRLFSFTTQKSGTANITPLSTALVGIANDGNPDIFTKPPQQLDLNTASTALKNFLSSVMDKYGVAKVDFISTPFDANGKGMDALLDSIHISIDSTNKTIEIKNPFTNDTIGSATLSNGTLKVNDSIKEEEANSLPQRVTTKKYFGYLKDDYGSPEQGPIMIDIVDDGNGKLSVTLSGTDGETGDPLLVYGSGTRDGNKVSFTAAVTICSDMRKDGGEVGNNEVTGKTFFTGTIDTSGKILKGTFTNTLFEKYKCKENNSDIYEGTFTAEDVTDAKPADIGGTYNFYFTPEGEKEEGPLTLVITQKDNVINVSISEGDKKVSGKGVIYGNYILLKVPVILCEDTNEKAVPEYATFLGRFDSEKKSIVGEYGDGLPPGDSCKKTSATGSWRAERVQSD